MNRIPRKRKSIWVDPVFRMELNDIRSSLIGENKGRNLRDFSDLKITGRIVETPSWEQVKRELVLLSKANKRGPLALPPNIRIKKDRKRLFE